MCDTIDAIKLHFEPDKLLMLNFLLAFLMFGIALNLKFADFKRIIESPRKAFAGILSQYLALPVITYLLVILFQPCPTIALGMFLLGACPGGNMSNFLSHLAKGNVALSVTLTATQTILAPLLTPVTFIACAGLYGPTSEILRQFEIDKLKLIFEILFVLGTPLCIGMLINAKFPAFTNKIIKPIQNISIVLFIGFLIFLFVNNYDIFLQIIGTVFILVLLHNGLAMAGGYGMASLFRLDFKDKKSLTIETGIHNATLGLIIIFNFFDGIGGMAVVAGWWGLWDLVTGFIVAGTWNYLDKKNSRLPA